MRGRAAGAPADLLGAGVLDGNAEDARRAAHDGGQLVGRVEVEALDDAEARAAAAR